MAAQQSAEVYATITGTWTLKSFAFISTFALRLLPGDFYVATIWLLLVLLLGIPIYYTERNYIRVSRYPYLESFQGFCTVYRMMRGAREYPHGEISRIYGLRGRLAATGGFCCKAAVGRGLRGIIIPNPEDANGPK